MAHLDIGRRFGRLVVVGPDPTSARHELCQCDCGRARRVDRYSLLKGETTSCNCLRSEIHAERLRTHGLTSRRQAKRIPREYSSWCAMKARCNNPRSPKYSSYGGRGIVVCDRWANSFEAFLQDMGPRPAGTTLDRLDTNGNYEPSNCRWATAKQQGNNRRRTLIVPFQEATEPLTTAAEKAGFDRRTVYERYHAGGDRTEARLFRPKRGTRTTLPKKTHDSSL